jgi:hypothetical protein
MSSLVLSRSMLTHRLRLVALAGALALAACGGGGDGQAPTQTTPPPAPPVVPAPVPGALTVHLATPNADDGAILLQITGPAPAAEVTSAAQGVVVHARANGNTSRVAVFGSLGSGALLRFSVPDVNAAQQFSAQVVEASDRGSALRPSVTAYQLTIAR